MQFFKKITPQIRREKLILAMKGKKNQGINCQSCTGLCCTFRANSMQMTPVETVDLLLFLEKEGRLTKELSDQLSQTIKDYRLNYHLDTGNGQGLRRTYTCPFFQEGPKGCSIDPSYKPYGCLGFNPSLSGESEGLSCYSDIKLLEEREKLYRDDEELKNQELRQLLDLDWDKLPIPMALLALWDKRHLAGTEIE